MKASKDTAKSVDSSKRRKLLDAAYTVFSRKGFHRATIDEIIAVADTGKGTVYNYFTNKEHLFYTLTTKISLPFEAELAQAMVAQQAPLAKLQQLIFLFLNFYVNHADLWRVVMHEMRGFGSDGYSHLSVELQEQYQAFFTRTINVLAQVLTTGINAGCIRDCNVKATAHSIFSVIVMMAFQNYVSSDIEAAAAQITDVLLNGIACS